MAKVTAKQSEELVINAMKAEFFEVTDKGNLCGFIGLNRLVELTGLAKTTVIHATCRLIMKGKLLKYQDRDPSSGCFITNFYELLEC